MSQTPRTPERNREQEHPSTPATISHTLRAGAVAVVTAPYTISRLLLRTLGLITPGDAPSTNPAVQQLNFELERGSGSSAVHEGAENARAVNINVVHRNGAGGARQRTTDEILLEGPTTVNEDEDVESPLSLRLSTKGDPDRSPIVLFPNLDTGERSRAEANASCGETPSDFRALLAAMEKLHDLVQMFIKNYALLGERLRSLEERRSLRTSSIADSGVDLSDNPFDSTGDSCEDKGEEGYTNKDHAELLAARQRAAATCGDIGRGGCSDDFSDSMTKANDSLQVVDEHNASLNDSCVRSSVANAHGDRQAVDHLNVLWTEDLLEDPADASILELWLKELLTWIMTLLLLSFLLHLPRPLPNQVPEEEPLSTILGLVTVFLTLLLASIWVLYGFVLRISARVMQHFLYLSGVVTSGGSAACTDVQTNVHYFCRQSAALRDPDGISFSSTSSYEPTLLQIADAVTPQEEPTETVTSDIILVETHRLLTDICGVGVDFDSGVFAATDASVGAIDFGNHTTPSLAKVGADADYVVTPFDPGVFGLPFDPGVFAGALLGEWRRRWMPLMSFLVHRLRILGLHTARPSLTLTGPTLLLNGYAPTPVCVGYDDGYGKLYLLLAISSGLGKYVMEVGEYITPRVVVGFPGSRRVFMAGSSLEFESFPGLPSSCSDSGGEVGDPIVLDARFDKPLGDPALLEMLRFLPDRQQKGLCADQKEPSEFNDLDPESAVTPKELLILTHEFSVLACERGDVGKVAKFDTNFGDNDDTVDFAACRERRRRRTTDIYIHLHKRLIGKQWRKLRRSLLALDSHFALSAEQLIGKQWRKLKRLLGIISAALDSHLRILAEMCILKPEPLTFLCTNVPFGRCLFKRVPSNFLLSIVPDWMEGYSPAPNVVANPVQRAAYDYGMINSIFDANGRFKLPIFVTAFIVWFLQPFEPKPMQMLTLHVGKPPYEHEASNICTAGLRIKAGELNPRFQLWMLQARGKDYPTAVPPDTLTEKRAAAYYRTSRQSIAFELTPCTADFEIITTGTGPAFCLQQFITAYFGKNCISKRQTQPFGAVGSNWQNRARESSLQTLLLTLRIFILYCALQWASDDAASPSRWWQMRAPSYADFLFNQTHSMSSGLSPMERLPQRARLGQFLCFSSDRSTLVDNDTLDTVFQMASGVAVTVDVKVQELWTDLLNDDGFTGFDSSELVHDVPPVDVLWLDDEGLRDREKRLQDNLHRHEQLRATYEKEFKSLQSEVCFNDDSPIVETPISSRYQRYFRNFNYLFKDDGSAGTRVWYCTPDFDPDADDVVHDVPPLDVQARLQDQLRRKERERTKYESQFNEQQAPSRKVRFSTDPPVVQATTSGDGEASLTDEPILASEGEIDDVEIGTVDVGGSSDTSTSTSESTWSKRLREKRDKILRNERYSAYFDNFGITLITLSDQRQVPTEVRRQQSRTATEVKRQQSKNVANDIGYVDAKTSIYKDANPCWHVTMSCDEADQDWVDFGDDDDIFDPDSVAENFVNHSDAAIGGGATSVFPIGGVSSLVDACVMRKTKLISFAAELASTDDATAILLPETLYASRWTVPTLLYFVTAVASDLESTAVSDDVTTLDLDANLRFDTAVTTPHLPSVGATRLPYRMDFNLNIFSPALPDVVSVECNNSSNPRDVAAFTSVAMLYDSLTTPSLFALIDGKLAVLTPMIGLGYDGATTPTSTPVLPDDGLIAHASTVLPDRGLHSHTSTVLPDRGLHSPPVELMYGSTLGSSPSASSVFFLRADIDALVADNVSTELFGLFHREREHLYQKETINNLSLRSHSFAILSYMTLHLGGSSDIMAYHSMNQVALYWVLQSIPDPWRYFSHVLLCRSHLLLFLPFGCSWRFKLETNVNSLRLGSAALTHETVFMKKTTLLFWSSIVSNWSPQLSWISTVEDFDRVVYFRSCMFHLLPEFSHRWRRRFVELSVKWSWLHNYNNTYFGNAYQLPTTLESLWNTSIMYSPSNVKHTDSPSNVKYTGLLSSIVRELPTRGPPSVYHSRELPAFYSLSFIDISSFVEELPSVVRAFSPSHVSSLRVDVCLNVRVTNGKSSFESSFANSLDIVDQSLLDSTLYAHSSEPVDDVVESLVDDDVFLDSGDTHDFGAKLLSKLHLMYLTSNLMMYSWAALGMTVPLVLLVFSAREGGLTLLLLKTIRGSEHIWDLFIKGLGRITSSSCDLSFLWNYDFLSLLPAGPCQLEKEMNFDFVKDLCRFRGDLLAHNICPVMMTSLSLERVSLRITASVVYMDQFCGGTWLPWSLFSLVGLQFGFNRWTYHRREPPMFFGTVRALRRSVSVSSRGATLVLVTPTRRQIWRRNIICSFTLDIAKCVSINTAKLEPYKNNYNF